jgi:predicted kinase
MTREILWKKFGLAGTPEAINFRETIVNLVRFHGFPPHVLEDEFALAKMYRAAANSLLGATDFTMDLLYRLAKADMEGRICQDKDDALAAVECFRDMAEQENILNWPPVFDDGSAYDTHQFLNFKTGDCKNPCLYDDTEVEVVLMCGLPGTGKDSWIMKCMEGRRPSTEVISLDDIRRELKLKPGDTNGIVIQTAKERAKEFLRKRQSFIWNATNLTQQQRRQLIDLFETYKARVFIDYLETTVNEQIRRNHDREDVVPQSTIDEMIAKIQLPEYFEAPYVSWNVV